MPALVDLWLIARKLIIEIEDVWLWCMLFNIHIQIYEYQVDIADCVLNSSNTS